MAPATVPHVWKQKSREYNVCGACLCFVLRTRSAYRNRCSLWKEANKNGRMTENSEFELHATNHYFIWLFFSRLLSFVARAPRYLLAGTHTHAHLTFFIFIRSFVVRLWTLRVSSSNNLYVYTNFMCRIEKGRPAAPGANGMHTLARSLHLSLSLFLTLSLFG